jgi:hypothetical protein
MVDLFTPVKGRPARQQDDCPLRSRIVRIKFPAHLLYPELNGPASGNLRMELSSSASCDVELHRSHLVRNWLDKLTVS